ncbi:hypothetical protein BJ165DRAFT_269521 [Panaeolus papilionaceus]|nr:hypothetical protein BJ165DRAFT_269521 [Panaeolus papilionaceus]
MFHKAAIAIAIIGSRIFAVSARLEGLRGAVEARSGTPSSSGIWPPGGFYFWQNGNETTQPQAYYSNGNSGQYSITWSGDGYLIGGKGWNPGGSRYERFTSVILHFLNSSYTGLFITQETTTPTGKVP